MSQDIYIVSLGCSKNLVDTEIIAGQLLSSGWGLTFDPAEADVYLVNTCAFIPSARREARQEIRTAVDWKRRRPKGKIVVAGCLMQHEAFAETRREFPAVDYWLGVNSIPEVVQLLAAPPATPESVTEPTYLYDHNTPRLQLTLPHYAYLKISDGCDNRCSYCAIPNLRGNLRSRTLESIVQEAKNLLHNGVRELLVIGQDITAFGQDRNDPKAAAELLRALDALPGDHWIRLLYTHPAHYTDDWIEAISGAEHILPYLDIPLQHINDRILQAMGRKVTRKEIVALLEKLRENIPGLTLRTTFITGFPGETEEEFAELRAFLTEQRFERCGVFAYAPEPGTPAAKLPGRIPGALAERRAAELMRTQEKIMKQRQKEYVGQSIRVLIDDVEDGVAVARGRMDAPEIDNRIFLTGPAVNHIEPGEFHRVRLLKVQDTDLIGELESPQ